MLKTIPSLIGAELLMILDSMGHGDDLALVDRNFPAAAIAEQTVSGGLVRLHGADNNMAAAAILSLFPLDGFVKTPIRFMEPVDAPGASLPVHDDLLAIARRAEGRDVAMAGIERHAFYAAARGAYGVVQTVEARPYGCFLLKKGVIND